MTLKGMVDRTVARALAPVPRVQRWWARRAADAEAAGPTPWAPFGRRFSECRAAVVTTGGFHLPDQPGFDCDRGDPTFREIPGDVPLADLRISHTHYDTRDARADPNILLPLDRLRELVAEGALGSVAPTHYSLMGYIPQVEALVGETAPAIVRRMGREEVDLALLTPA
ncbi:MAG TPA: glycine/sarcosine/betaine reductase selenoprotein B family protein [Gemmatimonadota bacterium]|nr:glycine/sarcosine/betaine reductase selenoprotein B family protein [Gemmatimonadota bacterium]